MIGLPTETEEDIEALVELVKKMKAQIKEIGGQFDITISTSTFIPKAQTPFELAERADKKTLEKYLNYLKKEFHKMGVTFRPSSVDWDVIQSILSRFDESLADLLIEVVERGGNLGAFKQVWREYSKKGALAPFDCVEVNPLSNIKTLMWSFINTSASSLKNNIQEKLGL